MITRYTPKYDVKPYYPSVLDIETRTDGSVISIGFAWESLGGNREYKTFDNWESWLAFYLNMLEGIKDEKQAVYDKWIRLYAHNGGGFDWLSLIEWFGGNGEYTISSGIMIASKMIGCRVNVGFKTDIWLLDSIALLPMGLAGLSEIFKIEHEKIDLEDKLPEAIYEEDKELFYEYLKNDVMGLQEIIREFWKMIYDLEGNIGNLPITLASLSMKLWRKDIAEGEVIKTTWNEGLKEFERRSYTGGRVEVFEYGYNDIISVHDINSLYPSVMVGAEFPVSYGGFWVDEFRSGDYGIYEVTYKQFNREVPAVLRCEIMGEFNYIGTGVYTNVELELLLEVGGSFEVITGYVYSDTSKIFEGFIRKWYGRRKEYKEQGNTAMDYVCKILMNSLYGKFGQKEIGNSIEVCTVENEDLWIEKGYDYRDYGNYAIVEKPLRVDHMFVIIASMVTSLSRVKLYRYMLDAIKQGKRVIYCDTDSVHSNGAEFNCDGELGSMKLEFVGSGTYLGRKLYEKIPFRNSDDCGSNNGEEKLKRSVVAKGVGKNSHKKILVGDFVNMRNGGNKIVEFNTAPTVREILAGKRLACQFFNRHRTIRIVRK